MAYCEIIAVVCDGQDVPGVFSWDIMKGTSDPAYPYRVKIRRVPPFRPLDLHAAGVVRAGGLLKLADTYEVAPKLIDNPFLPQR